MQYRSTDSAPQQGINPDELDRVSRALFFGYFTPNGEWVPGVLEALRRLHEEFKMFSEQIRREQNNSARVTRVMLQVVVALLALRFFGLDTLQSILGLIHHAGG